MEDRKTFIVAQECECLPRSRKRR